ncbi:MAG: PilZ domain-containing protein [Burkholderiaceae bacterium]|nr:PilZ domain-containing protein [Burkholderiaceae bacterium]
MDPRREHVKRLLQVDAHLTDMDGQHNEATQIIDISRHGVAFLSEHAMPIGENFVLHFSFPGCDLVNHVALTVLHSAHIGSHGRYRNDAYFLSMPADCAIKIADYLTSPPEAE